MNIFESQENVFLFGRIVVMAIVLPVFLYVMRYGLRIAHEQFMKLGRFAKCAVICIVCGSTGYAGYKHWCTTNPPPDQTSSPTNNANSLCGDCGVPGGHALPSILMLSPPSTSTFNLNLITNWTARGAYCDWRRIDFPDTFAFPSGTNLLTGVTLMSYGELRPSLLPNPYSLIPPLSALPQPVSIEPDMSSVSYGLTSSNSFVFVWENACVDRDPTNRVNAAIELFEDGSIETRFGNLVGRAVPSAPEGFVGEGQDTDWSTNAFPFAAAEIAEKGYQGWLDDHIGYNEPNGRYQVKVTVAALPEHGPCYLVVGPHRMVVTQPGTYSFPLEVFETYKAYTCPTRVPLTFEYDDGYDYGDDPTPPLCMSPMMAAAMTPQEELEYELSQIPAVHIRPSRIERCRAGNTPVEILCNMASAVKDYVSTVGDDFRLTFLSQTEAEIIEVAAACLVEISLENSKGRVTGQIEIYPCVCPVYHETNGVDTAGSMTNAPPPAAPPDGD